MEELQPEALEQAPIEDKINWKQFIWDIFETVVLAVLLYIGINAITARVRVDGFSMRPTLDDGEFVLVNRMSYRFGDIERGDIIVFNYPANPDQELIKRVIGLSGDQVTINNGQVALNGYILNESYIAAAPQYNGEWNVPYNYVFVLGDNRNNSSDSHAWGMLPIGNIVGKATVIYWPPKMWEVIRHANLLASTP
ncbi:MAG: signal peptidase I [Anaerolineales bacterium]|nr:signal peptidase I [Anaerolineales bacterium]